MCLLVLVVTILGVGFGTEGFSKEEGSADKGIADETLPPEVDVSDEGASTPAPDSREGRIYSHIASKSQYGEDILTDPATGEAQALQWLMDEDPVDLDPLDFEDQIRLDQRFALLTIWFSSTQAWFNETNWLNDDECTWLGVTCGEPTPETQRNRRLQNGTSVVTKVEIEGNNLFGTVPPDLSLLVDLQILNLRGNFMEGSLPVVLGDLSQLTTFVINENTLTGDLTGFDFAKFPSLKILDLSSNGFTGPFPATVYSMPAIEVLVMDDNDFTGEISASIANLLTLGKLGLATNRVNVAPVVV
jgi:hypothetical protein